MSKYKKKNRFCFIKNIINSYYFIIAVSLLSFIVFISENNSLVQIIEAQSSNTQIQNNNVNTQGSLPAEDNNFLMSGPLSSFLSTPTGNWVVNGSWALKVQNGNVSFFSGNMQWDPTNLTKLSHTHNFANFRALPDTQSISLGPNRVIDIKGVMDIGANNKIEWVNVPSEIKTAGNTITVSILDDAKTGNHFNNYPIFGKIEKVSQINTPTIANNPINNNGQSIQSTQPQSAQSIQSTQPQSAQSIQSTQPQSAQSIQSTQPQSAQSIQSTQPQSAQSIQSTQPQSAQQTIIPPHEATKSFRMNGNIDSVIYTTSGSKWNTVGSWILTVDNGKVALFNINTTWQNATNSDTYEFMNLKTKTKNITLKPSNGLSLKGNIDLGKNNQISWTNVPTTIDIASGKTITISVDDAKTDHHFAGHSIHG